MIDRHRLILYSKYGACSLDFDTNCSFHLWHFFAGNALWRNWATLLTLHLSLDLGVLHKMSLKVSPHMWGTVIQCMNMIVTWDMRTSEILCMRTCAVWEEMSYEGQTAVRWDARWGIRRNESWFMRMCVRWKMRKYEERSMLLSARPLKRL